MKLLPSVSWSDASIREKAEQVAHQLNLLVHHEQFPQLLFTPSRIELIQKGFKPLSVDFSQVRLARADMKKQGIMQACKPRSGISIIDATAGWGKDAAFLALAGADVLMLERNPVMGVLLQDGLDRLSEQSLLKQRLSLKVIDAKTYLNTLGPHDFPDVIYIDPMHPERQKTALVKKDMQLLQTMIGEDKDVIDLLEIAGQKTREKVVLKWPQKAKALINPSYTCQGKTVRFDVYLKN